MEKDSLLCSHIPSLRNRILLVFIQVYTCIRVYHLPQVTLTGYKSCVVLNNIIMIMMMMIVIIIIITIILTFTAR